MKWFDISYSDIIMFDEATIYTWLGVYSSIFRVIQLLIALWSFSLHRHDLCLNENKRIPFVVHCPIALLLNNVKEWCLNDLQAWKYKNSKPYFKSTDWI